MLLCVGMRPLFMFCDAPRAVSNLGRVMELVWLDKLSDLMINATGTKRLSMAVEFVGAIWTGEVRNYQWFLHKIR